MLDERDLQQFGQLLDTKLDARFVTFERKFEVKLDQRFIAFEQKLEATLVTKLAEQEKKIIHAVGEMLEDNVFPQFEEIHRELRRINTVLTWQA